MREEDDGFDVWGEDELRVGFAVEEEEERVFGVREDDAAENLEGEPADTVEFAGKEEPSIDSDAQGYWSVMGEGMGLLRMNASMTGGKYVFSRMWILSARESGVSEGERRQRAWNMVEPWSKRWSTRWMVMPL